MHKLAHNFKEPNHRKPPAPPLRYYFPGGKKAAQDLVTQRLQVREGAKVPSGFYFSHSSSPGGSRT